MNLRNRRPSSFRLAVTQRLVRSWTRWRLTLTKRRLAKENRRLQLLQVQMDHQLLLLKELEQQELWLLQKRSEQQEILAYRMQEQPIQQEPQLTDQELMDQLLGMQRPE